MLNEEQKEQLKAAAYDAAETVAREMGLMTMPDSGTEKIIKIAVAATVAALDAYDVMTFGDGDGGY